MPSTVISHFTFNPEQRVLRVYFVSGIVYDYKDVPEHIYLEMKNSFSKGIYFNQQIKGKYDFERVKV